MQAPSLQDRYRELIDACETDLDEAIELRREFADSLREVDPTDRHAVLRTFLETCRERCVFVVEGQDTQALVHHLEILAIHRKASLAWPSDPGNRTAEELLYTAHFQLKRRGLTLWSLDDGSDRHIGWITAPDTSLDMNALAETIGFAVVPADSRFRKSTSVQENSPEPGCDDPYAPPSRSASAPLPQSTVDELARNRRILAATVLLGIVYAVLAVDGIALLGRKILDPTRPSSSLQAALVLLSGIKLPIQLAGSIGLIATRRWGARLFLAAGAITILQRILIGNMPWQSVLFFAACGFVLFHFDKYKA